MQQQSCQFDFYLLVSSVWSCSIVCCLRCVGYACAYGVRRPTFFQQKKKGSKKCRSHAPRDWHSANRFVAHTTCVGLQGGLQDGCGLRDGLARCARWHDLVVFWDGIFAMVSLNDGVRSRESFAGRISHHVRSTSIRVHRWLLFLRNAHVHTPPICHARDSQKFWRDSRARRGRFRGFKRGNPRPHRRKWRGQKHLDESAFGGFAARGRRDAR